MDTPENYYAILGVLPDVDNETLKSAYRQLARRYHPDLAGPEGALQMKRINRAYDVLSDSEKRFNYDTLMGGTIDLRQGGLTRPRPVARKFSAGEDVEFAGLSIFATRGPLRAGAKLQSGLGVVSSLNGIETSAGLMVAAGSLDGKGICWQVEKKVDLVHFRVGEGQPVESLRELRFSEDGALLSAWGRLNLHVWQTGDGSLLWDYPLEARAVSAHYSLDMVPQHRSDGGAAVWMALPLQLKDPLAPRAQSVRGTDVVAHELGTLPDKLCEPVTCVEDELEKRRFWAVRLRALSTDLSTLCTLSCANVPDEPEQMIILRRWSLTGRSRFGSKARPHIQLAVTAGLCSACAPPYAMTPDTKICAFVHNDRALRLHDTTTGTYSELPGGTMGASARLAISFDGEWVAVAREDSEINEGVIDLWSVSQGQIVQKLYHPWQIGALHFVGKALLVALTDGTIQIWQ